jgi:ATP-dependent phosphoenolpyruvate carboxykinase
MKLGHTRAMVHAVLHGDLHDVKMNVDPIFGLAVPAAIEACPRMF